MTKASLIALTAFVWMAAFAGTGALVHIVQHPLPLPPVVSEVNLTAAIAQAPQKPQPAPANVEERVITLATVEIVGSLPPPPVVKKEEPKPRELHCHEWRSLEQGSNSVQICD